MSLGRVLGYLHLVLIVVFVLYAGIRFPDGEVVPCAELRVCRDPSYEGPAYFDKKNCAPGNYCASKSSRLRSIDDVEPSKNISTIVSILVLSGLARLLVRRILDAKKVNK
jgi:hypothetical protein